MAASSPTTRKSLSSATGDSLIQKKRERVLLLIFVLLLLPVAVWMWTVWMPQRNNRFAAASLQELESVVDVAHIDSTFANTGTDAIFQLVQRYRLLELNERALVILRRASPLDPDDQRMWLAWAAVAESVSTKQEARAVLLDYLRRHEQDTDAHLALGWFYRRAGLLEKASAEGKIVSRLEPKNPDGWRLLGTTAIDTVDRATAESAFRKVVELAPEDWEAHLDLGVVLYDLQRTKEALPFFYEAVRLAPDAAEPHFRLAQGLLRVATTPATAQEAQNHLRRSAQLNPELPYPRLSLGQSYMRQGRWEDAWREFKLVNASPQPTIKVKAISAYNSAIVLDRLGKPADAARERERHRNINAYLAQKTTLTERILVTPTNLDLRLQLARLCARYEVDFSIGAYQRLLSYAPQALAAKQVGVQEKVQIASRELAQVQASAAQAQSLLETANTKQTEDSQNENSSETRGRERTSHGADSLALQDAPLSLKEILRDADYLFARKRWDEARRAYLVAAQTDEKSGRAFEGAGLSMLQGEDKAQGIKFLHAAISLEPNLSRANFVIGSLCLEAGIRRGAVRYLDMATRAAPDNAAYWHQLSLAYADGDMQLKEAENAARRAAELEPRNLNYQLDLGEAQEAINKLDEAEITYRKALNAAPENITGSVRLGSFLVNRRSDAKRVQEGVALLQKALKRDPKDGYALFSLGRFYLKQKQPTKAIGFLQKAVAVSPDVRESWYSLGRARQMNGDFVGAKKAIQRSQELAETYLDLETAMAWAKRVPRDVSRRRDLARRYAAAGHYANAIHQYEIGVQLQPQDKELRSELERYRKSLAENGQMPPMDVFYALTGAADSPQRN